MRQFIYSTAFLLTSILVQAQTEIKIDTILKSDTKPLKIQHAEPLYIDLMRDLGAHKGEAEFNLGFGVANHKSYYEYNGFIEYEWAIADRLGLEVEVPFSFNKGIGTINTVPNNRVEGIKMATQYTFLVSEKHQTSLAIGYIHEFELNNFKNLGNKGVLFEGMKINPIFIAAKKMEDIHTLIYVGPIIENHFTNHKTQVYGTLNASIHYMIPNQKHFIGIENNMEIHQNDFVYVMRPQVKLALQHNLAVGIVTGIPIIHKNDMKMDFMTRIIWEPNF